MRFGGTHIADLILLMFANILLDSATVTAVQGVKESQQKELALNIQKSLDYIELLEKDPTHGTHFLVITIYHAIRGIAFITYCMMSFLLTYLHFNLPRSS